MQDLMRQIIQTGLCGSNAMPDPADIFEGVDFASAGKRVTGYAFTLYELAVHMHHWAWLKAELFEGREIAYPEDHYFPAETAPKSAKAWEAIKEEYRENILKISGIATQIDLTRRFPAWENKTAAEMLMTMINHNSYHASQVVGIRRGLGKWEERG
jgi:uncharacterized damage-inducible protein DinB